VFERWKKKTRGEHLVRAAARRARLTARSGSRAGLLWLFQVAAAGDDRAELGDADALLGGHILVHGLLVLLLTLLVDADGLLVFDGAAAGLVDGLVVVLGLSLLLVDGDGVRLLTADGVHDLLGVWHLAGNSVHNGLVVLDLTGNGVHDLLGVLLLAGNGLHDGLGVLLLTLHVLVDGLAARSLLGDALVDLDLSLDLDLDIPHLGDARSLGARAAWVARVRDLTGDLTSEWLLNGHTLHLLDAAGTVDLDFITFLYDLRDAVRDAASSRDTLGNLVVNSSALGDSSWHLLVDRLSLAHSSWNLLRHCTGLVDCSGNLVSYSPVLGDGLGHTDCDLLAALDSLRDLLLHLLSALHNLGDFHGDATSLRHLTRHTAGGSDDLGGLVRLELHGLAALKLRLGLWAARLLTGLAWGRVARHGE
jgi:hypothetical protein